MIKSTTTCRPQSISSSSHCSSTKSNRSFWSRIGQLFHHSNKSRSNFSHQITGNYSSATLSDVSVKTLETERSNSRSQRRHRKQLSPTIDTSATQMIIPPFSPTYCKANEFPYSNFYVKLPDGKWMVRYRDGNRDILRTDIVEGYMI
ncbi:MAG: hypothetical protein EXX96DRAFT_598219 [Benjaminiella poitrasii]|nr:MAG: hypothetical protein EXX96DRAFT_598219 [Benjaminiella poitrasii]